MLSINDHRWIKMNRGLVGSRVSHHLLGEHPCRPALCSQAIISRIKPSDSTTEACQPVSHNRRKTNTDRNKRNWTLYSLTIVFCCSYAAVTVCAFNLLTLQQQKDGQKQSDVKQYRGFGAFAGARWGHVTEKRELVCSILTYPRHTGILTGWLDDISGCYGHPVNVGILPTR